ncbi:MAG: LolA family protein [Micromonosporaceae bacterium]
MPVLTSRSTLRWLAPVAVAAAVLGGGAGIGALTAAAEPELAPRSAAQLLVDLQTARLDGLSGTVVARADLGLPTLPGVGAQSVDLTALLAGTHTLRVWYAGPDRTRIALLGPLAETDIVRNGRDLWVWNSRANTAKHSLLPATDPARAGKPTTLLPDDLPFTPQQLADAALAMLDPTTVVSTDGSARVAGRPAYELVLAPRDTTSLVAQVRLAIDATEHLPLRVQVVARDGGGPAIEVAFTQISFARPDPEQFRFNPPPGAQVTEGSTGANPDGPASKGHSTKESGTMKPGDPMNPGAMKPDPLEPGVQAPGAAERPFAVVGKGWTSVLVTRMPAAAGSGENRRDDGPGGLNIGALLAQLPRVSGAWGSGRLMQSRLVSVLLTDDGRLLVGAVTPQRLTDAAKDPAARLGS